MPIDELEVVQEEKEDMSERISQQTKSYEVFNSQVTSLKYPMEKQRFVEIYRHVLTYYEKKELENTQPGQESEKMVYFAGGITDRVIGSPTKGKKECDDEEGYFIVNIGEHVFYRFEITKILGKGSFAQVVSCIDHKTGLHVAIKINRNTEIDHKFAK